MSIMAISSQTLTRKRKRNIIIIGFLFVAVYFLVLNPAFTFMGGLHTVLLLFPLLFLFVFPKINKQLRLYKRLFFCWLLLFTYVLLRTLMGGETAYVVFILMLLLEGCLISYVIIRIAILNRIDFEEILLLVASVAGIISCICLFVPPVNEFTKSIQVITNDYLLTNLFRGFGIGEGLTFGYSVALGSICALGICTIDRHKWFIPFIPIIFIATIINARTGIVPIGIAFVFFLVSSRKVSYWLYSILVLALIVVLWIEIFEELVPEETLLWVLKFFTEIGEGKDGGTYMQLVSTFPLPDTILEWIFGKGFSVFDPPRGDRSDIGYLIQINYGGIIYCFFLVMFLIQLLRLGYKFVPRPFFWTMTLSMLIFNYKGEYVGSQAFFIFILSFFYFIQAGNIKEYKSVQSSK